MTPKLVIATNGNYFARLILNGLFTEHPDWISGVLVVTGDYKARSGVRALWEVGKVTTKPYLFYKVASSLSLSAAQSLFPGAALSVGQWAHVRQVPLLEVQAVNSDDALSWVAAIEPDLLVSVSCPQMIRKKMLAIPKRGSINIHSSLLPAYAGLAPYYWVLSTGEGVTGTTVHYMTLKFDEGNILAQEQLETQPGESAFHLFKRLAVVGSTALSAGVTRALAGDVGTVQDHSRYTYFSHPTLSSYRALRKHGHVLLRSGELIDTINQERHRSASRN